jgi:hypothetical protein
MLEKVRDNFTQSNNETEGAYMLTYSFIELIRDDLSDQQLPDIAQHLFPQLFKIYTNEHVRFHVHPSASI